MMATLASVGADVAKPKPALREAYQIVTDATLRSPARNLARSERCVGHYLIGFAQSRFGFRNVGTNACERCHHCRLLIVRQADKLAATFHPCRALLGVHRARHRIERHGHCGAVPVDDLLQILGQRVVPVWLTSSTRKIAG